MIRKMKKRGQEEMVGFALIIILVSVIILGFLGFLLRTPKREAIESYEIENFLQAILQYTSDCQDSLGYLPVENLITECDEGNSCLNGKSSCEVLNNTLKGIIAKSWPVGETNPVKGYELNITVEEEGMLMLKQGNRTGNYKGAFQTFERKGNSYQIYFKAYS